MFAAAAPLARARSVRANDSRLTRRADAVGYLCYKILCKRVGPPICARESAVGCSRWLGMLESVVLSRAQLLSLLACSVTSGQR
jgi:hypothetical protein